MDFEPTQLIDPAHYESASAGAVAVLPPGAEPALPQQVGQAVQCGRWALVFNFLWTNAIIDDYELVAIPGAADWLAGAANIEGSIVPVVDLAVYFEPDAKQAVADRHRRLLLGGRVEGSNENAAALLFSKLPFQIQYTREPISPDAQLPERLLEVCSCSAISSSGESYFEIDTERFVEFLSLNLL
jgi:chemotaxis signal transduction protein